MKKHTKKRKSAQAVLEEMIDALRELQKRGEPETPRARDEYYDDLFNMEDVILEMVGLPGAQKFQEILREGETKEIVYNLMKARMEYETGKLDDPGLAFLDLIVTGETDPFNGLPILGFTVHNYGMYLYTEVALKSANIKVLDRVLRELRLAEENLDSLGRLEAKGIVRHRRDYTRLRNLGFEYLDEYLIHEGKFNLGEEEMGPEQLDLYGTFLIDEGEYGKAIRIFTSLLKRVGDNPSAYYKRGVAYQHLEKNDRAVADYSAAIRCDDAHMPAYLNRGMLFAMAGRTDAAMADFDRAIELEPGNAAAYCNRGNLNASLDEQIKAIADFSTAIELQPMNEDLYCNRGVSLYRQGYHELAYRDLVKSASLGSGKAKQALEEFFGEPSQKTLYD
jgi:tetratricopeptide (TPR) repeat protein